MSLSCACIGSPCLRDCVHGAPVGGGGGSGGAACAAAWVVHGCARLVLFCLYHLRYILLRAGIPNWLRFTYNFEVGSAESITWRRRRYTWLYSLYCFEYRWSLRGWSLQRQLRTVEAHWAFFGGFGTPVSRVFLRVHWVAVPKPACARRVNARPPPSRCSAAPAWAWASTPPCSRCCCSRRRWRSSLNR
eukprot:COSAG01_NODE_3962_length_5492_cov_71.874281_2_plen_189_part_00